MHEHSLLYHNADKVGPPPNVGALVYTLLLCKHQLLVEVQRLVTVYLHNVDVPPHVVFCASLQK